GEPSEDQPRFWAAFVAQGNMRPVSFLTPSENASFPQPSWWTLLLSSGGLFGLAIYLGKRRRIAKFSGIDFSR
ncbi:MAG: hypothetical protein AAFQ87_21935, partial [Bacteroidota bacterium]